MKTTKTEIMTAFLAVFVWIIVAFVLVTAAVAIPTMCVAFWMAFLGV